MSVFDKLHKKNILDEKMEEAYQFVLEKNPVMQKARENIAEAEDIITKALEDELYGEEGPRPSKEVPLDEDADIQDDEEGGDITEKWNSMIDQIMLKNKEEINNKE